MSSWWGKGDTGDPRGGRDGDHKNKNKLEHRVTQSTQRCRVRGVPSTREQGSTANKEQRL